MLGDEILRSEHDFRRRFGLPSFRALNEFHKTCTALYSSSDYYEGHVAVDRQHPWAHRTFREVLNKIPDENARRYVETAVRSDTATEPHLTSALNGLKNVAAVVIDVKTMPGVHVACSVVIATVFHRTSAGSSDSAVATFPNWDSSPRC